MPRGYQPIPESGPPAQDKTPLSDLLESVRGLQGEGISRSTVTPGKVSGGGGGAPRSSGGKGAFRGGGGYAGTEGLAKSTPTFGLNVSSEKRSRKFTSSGGVSDHWEGSRRAYAQDLSGSKAQMDRAWREHERHFGRKLKYNAINNFVIRTRRGNKVRVQLIYGPKVGHGDHIHRGFRR